MARGLALTCCCCGGPAPALKHWYNRDKGFGLCGTCAVWIKLSSKMTPEEFERSYGYKGIHWLENKDVKNDARLPHQHGRTAKADADPA